MMEGERHENIVETYTLDDAINKFGIGRFQYFVIFIGGLSYLADSMEIMVLSFLGPIMKCRFDITPEEQSTMATSVFIGMGIGAFLCGILADKFGRKTGAITTAIFCSFGGVFSALVNTYGMLIFARFIVGLGMGGVPVAYSWVMEFVPASSRGRVGVIVQSFWTAGTLFQVTVSWITLPTTGFRWMLIITAVPLFILLGMFFCVPESIRFLLSTGQNDRAKNMLIYISKMNKTPLPKGELKLTHGTHNERNIMTANNNGDINNGDNNNNTFDKIKSICAPAYRHDTIMLFIMWVANAAIYYGVVLLTTELIQINKANEPTQYNFNNNTRRSLLQDNNDLTCSRVFHNSAFVEIFGSAFSETPGMILTFFLVDKIGRKKTQASLFAFVTFVFGILFLIDKRDETLDTVLLAIVRACILGSFTVIYIYTPERFDTKIRSTAMGILVAGSRLGSMISPFISVSLPERGYVKLTFLIYGFFALFATISSMCLKLETTGISMDNIQNENKKIEMKSRMMRSSNEDNNKASTSISNVALNFQPLNEVDDGDGV